MKRIFLLSLIIGGVLAGTACSIHAEGTNEADLIAVLQSKTDSPKQKTQACAQLKLEGTRASAKALGDLLADPTLSHSARYVLETLPGPEADTALIDALPKTHGLMQAGIIDSLAMRTNAGGGAEIRQALGFNRKRCRGRFCESSRQNRRFKSAWLFGSGREAIDQRTASR